MTSAMKPPPTRDASPNPGCAEPHTSTPFLPLKWLARLGLFAVASSFFAWVLHQTSIHRPDHADRAGFLLGAAHGALMPTALPSLLLGKEVSIYAVHNSGRNYNLGYTFGVNACGAAFFGLLYYRLSKWRQTRRDG